MVTPDMFRCHTETKVSKYILYIHVKKKKEKEMLKELKERRSLMSEWENVSGKAEPLERNKWKFYSWKNKRTKNFLVSSIKEHSVNLLANEQKFLNPKNREGKKCYRSWVGSNLEPESKASIALEGERAESLEPESKASITLEGERAESKTGTWKQGDGCYSVGLPISERSGRV